MDSLTGNLSLNTQTNDKDCYSCSHQDVCIFKKEFLALKQKVALDIVNKDKPFDVVATCRHFSGYSNVSTQYNSFRNLV